MPRRPRRRPVRTLTRKARRAIRRRLRRTAHKARARLAAIRQRRRARQLEIQRAATDLTARSITGKPRPAKATAAPARPATATVPAGGAAPMTARVKRSRDGKFNGSTGASKKTTGKKTASKSAAQKASALTPEARKAAATQRALAAGNNRVARIDKRSESLDRLTIELFKATRLRDELNNTGPNRNREQIRQLDAHIKQLSARYWPAYFDDMRRKERDTPPANG